MDTLQLRRTIRLLLWFCVGLFLGGYSVLSHAARSYPATPINGYCYGTSYPVTTSAIGCASNYGYANCSATGGANGENKCCKAGSATNCGLFSTTSVKTCPYGGTLSGSTCINAPDCPADTIADPTTGQCKPKNKCTGDQKLDVATNTCKCDAGKTYNGYTPATGSGALVCFNGCESQINNASNQYAVNGQQVWKGSWNSTGSPCVAGLGNGTVNPGSSGSGSGSGGDSGGDGSGGDNGDSTQKCPGTKVPGGTLNGKVICIDPSPSNPSTTIGKSETDPDGPGSTPGTTITKKIECDGANCTTTTTTQNGDGTTNTKTDKQDQKSFCESNPNLTICKDSEATAGANCTTPPTCNGDAVTCAILKQQWTLGCMYEVETAESATYAAAKAGTDGFDPDKMRSNAAVVTVNSQFDTSHFLSSNCPQAKTVTVMGHSVSLPFDASCEGAVWMGRVAVAITLVMAAMIVIGGIK